MSMGMAKPPMSSKSKARAAAKRRWKRSASRIFWPRPMWKKGKKLFKKCVACHKTEEGANATGPYLYGVVGRPVAGVAGFNYSDAMKAHGGRMDSGRAVCLPGKPQELHSRQQDDVQGPLQARGSRQHHRLSGQPGRLIRDPGTVKGPSHRRWPFSLAAASRT
ncbi:c-type cytochrome [Jhaorihella thermophila]